MIVVANKPEHAEIAAVLTKAFKQLHPYFDLHMGRAYVELSAWDLYHAHEPSDAYIRSRLELANNMAHADRMQRHGPSAGDDIIGWAIWPIMQIYAP